VSATANSFAGLRRQRHGDHQGEGAVVVQLGAWVALGGLEAGEQLGDTGLFGGRQAFFGGKSDGLGHGLGKMA
jgi:hypothetical protein